MKILELCTYSAGGCGVFARVKRESVLLKERGHEVKIFSSNFEKGTNNTVALDDEVEGVKIKRFPAKKLGGESYTEWDFTKEAIKYRPDVIIAHAYRHTHTAKAIKVAKQLRCKVFLVTHAPFDRDNTRTKIQRTVVGLYDRFKGPKNLKGFDKVFAISKWEIPYLRAIGIKNKDIIYIPNGILDDFFKGKASKPNNNIITFTGRVAPIKNLEIVIKALAISQNKELKFEIFGPCEAEYKKLLLNLIKEYNLEKRVIIYDQKYGPKEQVAQLDRSMMYILPSHSEGMPQALVEAMARGMVVIASDIKASRDLIEDKKNGFLFKTNDEKSLANLLNEINTMDKNTLNNIKNNGRESVEKFSWTKILNKIEEEITTPINCVVIGGAGFIGSHVTEELLKLGKKVIVVDNLSTGKLSNIPKATKFIQADITENFDQLDFGRVDCIFHLAGQVSVKKSFANPKFDVQENIIGTLNVFNFCVRNNVKKIIFSSSAAVYDPMANLPLTEKSKTNPLSPYGLTKKTVENYLEILSREKQIDYVCLRYSNVYGPRQNPSGEAGVISIFLDNLLKNKPITINGDGNQTRDFIFVSDVAKANTTAINVPSGVYNVSSNKETSVNQIVNLLIKNINLNAEIIKSKPLNELRRSKLSYKKLEQFGWKPEVELDSGISKTVNWFRKFNL